jgi:hypothetical protein
MKKSMTLLLAGMLLFGMAVVANAATISYTGGQYLGPFGTSDYSVATVGQTFRLSVEGVGDNILDSVTFWITASQGDVRFKFYLYEWDSANSKITGTPLFESGQLSTDQNLGDEKFTVDVGGVELNVDRDYVFFVSTSGFFDGSQSEGSIRVAFYYDCFFFFPEDLTPDYKLVKNNNGDDFSLLSSTVWDRACFDMAFEMVLSPSGPEPEPEPAATFELTRAKVDLKKGTIKVDGQVVLPEGVTWKDLDPEGSVKLHLFEIDRLVEAVNDSVLLEVKGRNGEKWHYKNHHAFGVTEYKVHWKDKDEQTGKVKITADFDPGLFDLSRLTPKLVAEITLGDLAFEVTIAEDGQYDCKLKRKKWNFRNRP